MPTPNIILIGMRASGKTGFSEYVSKKYGYKIVRLSDIIKEIAQEKGWAKNNNFNKQLLQDWGLELKRENGMDFLAMKAAEKTKGSGKYIFDGARELDEVNTLKEKVGNTVSVYIDASFEARFQRVSKREGWSLEEFKKIEKHIVDSNIKKLKGAADHIIANNFSTLDEFHNVINEFIQNFE